MKKFTFFGIAALIVLLAAVAIISCNMDTPKEDEEPGIVLNVGKGGGRALTGPTAEAGTTFYEASFKNVTVPLSPTYIRTFWNWNTTGRIQLLPGTYEMILFAGRGSDRTLLGVGRVTAITNSDSSAGTINGDGSFVITPATRGLTLTLEPLVTDVGGSYTPEDSTFIVIANSADPGNDPVEYTKYDKVNQLGDFVPLFHLKKNDVAEVQWHFGVGDVDGPDNHIADYADDIIVTAGAVIHNAGFMVQDSVEQPIKLTAATTKYIAPASGSPIDPATGFELELGVPDNDGMAQVAIEVPVVAYNSTTANPQIWWIRGGLNNGLLDVGATPTNGVTSPSMIGGAIVVGFGELSNMPIITITPGTGWGLGGGTPPPTPTPIAPFALDSYVIAPVAGAVPDTTGFSGTGYTATIVWSTSPANFQPTTVYTATVTLTAAPLYNFSGVGVDSFTYTNSDFTVGTATNAANSGVITITFTTTEAQITDDTITLATAPANFISASSATITSTSTEYTATIEWEETGTPGVPFTGTFGSSTGYTALITITPETGYTYYDLAANFFSVTTGTTISVDFDDSTGIITVVY